ncbi:MAG: hypothetical protein DHS20C13_08710 [Thermodesulfobacteriota bacterium]|nr:MAG: hypothetical protein DHS20C13_08710 [Thermodesulfobacteriota bacterium]
MLDIRKHLFKGLITILVAGICSAFAARLGMGLFQVEYPFIANGPISLLSLFFYSGIGPAIVLAFWYRAEAEYSVHVKFRIFTFLYGWYLFTVVAFVCYLLIMIPVASVIGIILTALNWEIIISSQINDIIISGVSGAIITLFVILLLLGQSLDWFELS